MQKKKVFLRAGIAFAAIAITVGMLFIAGVFTKTDDDEGIAVGTLPIYSGGTYGGKMTGNAEQITHLIEQTTEKEFSAYLKKLKHNGFKTYADNTVTVDAGKNLFASFTKEGEKTVYAYYIAAENRAHIIELPAGTLLETRKKDNAYTKKSKVCEPLFTQVQLKYDRATEGMSYLMRLSDGRFIIVDGGATEADNYESHHLYALMQQQNVLDTITVAAWFITHPHGDHIDVATEFLNRFDGNDLKIEQILFNFETGTRADSFGTAVEKWKKLGAQVVTPHTGQVHHFADAKIEILHTVEDFYPLSTHDLTENKVNNTSVTFCINIAGQKIAMLGDIGETGSDEMVAMWGSYLKSDIMQMAHHGLPGGTVELYTTIDPTIVVLPTTAYNHTKYFNEFRHFQKDTTRAGKAFWWLYDNDAEQFELGTGNVKEVIISGFSEETLQLPYQPAEDGEYFSNRNNNGYRFTEPSERPDTTLPAPYMDLQFADGTITNVGTANVDVVNRKGIIDTYTVYHKGEEVEVNAFYAEPNSGGRITATLNDIASPAEFKELVDGGITLEMCITLDSLPETPGGGYNLFGSRDGNGLMLTLENPTLNLHFQMADSGSTHYIDAMPNAIDRNWNGNIVAGNTVQHIVATYNPADKTLTLYQNGVAVSSGKMQGEFLAVENEAYNQLGIGFNPAASGQALTNLTGYTLITSRVYDTCLTADQVALAYFETTDTFQ